MTLPQRSTAMPCSLAVGVQARGALDAQPRLQRARLVVDAGVDDAGVVAGLAGADLVGGVDHGHAQARDGARAARARWPGRRCPPRRWRGRSAPRAARVVVAVGATAVAWSVVQVLVTGASGAIGAELVPRLARRRPRRARLRPRPGAGHRGGRRRGRARRRGDRRRASTRRSTASTSPTSSSTRWRPALNGDGSVRRPRPRGARERFAAAARAAGVRRVVYLGGLVPADAPASPHLASRLEVEEALLAAAPEAVALRASIVDRRALALVPLPRAPRRARAGHAAAGLARAPHAADRRARRDRLPRSAPGTSDVVRRPAVARHRRPGRRHLRASSIERIRDALLLGRPRVDLPVTMTADRAAAWPPRSPARTPGSSAR